MKPEDVIKKILNCDELGAAKAYADVALEMLDSQGCVNVVLTDSGRSKISAIKVIRQQTGIGLKEAKDLVEAVPRIVAHNISIDTARDLLRQFDEIGASAEIV